MADALSPSPIDAAVVSDASIDDNVGVARSVAKLLIRRPESVAEAEVGAADAVPDELTPTSYKTTIKVEFVKGHLDTSRQNETYQVEFFMKQKLIRKFNQTTAYH